MHIGEKNWVYPASIKNMFKCAVNWDNSFFFTSLGIQHSESCHHVFCEVLDNISLCWSAIKYTRRHTMFVSLCGTFVFLVYVFLRGNSQSHTQVAVHRQCNTNELFIRNIGVVRRRKKNLLQHDDMHLPQHQSSTATWWSPTAWAGPQLLLVLLVLFPKLTAMHDILELEWLVSFNSLGA